MRIVIIDGNRIELEQLEYHLKKLAYDEAAAGLADHPIDGCKKLREANSELELIELNGFTAAELVHNLISRSQGAAPVESQNSVVARLPKAKKVFALDGLDNIILLNTNQIELFKLEGRDVIVTSGGKHYKTRHSLNYWEERLEDQGFFRCHKSYLINIDKIKKLKPMFNGTYLLKIDNCQREVAVSRSRAKLLTELLGL